MMNLVPYSWQRQLDNFENQMNNFFRQWAPTTSREESEWFPFGNFNVPSVDVEETDSEVIVRAEMPGLEKDEFSIELHDNRLYIKGEKKQKSEDKKRNYHRVECSYGSFTRSVQLPSEVDVDKANAEYKHGVLNITLPKSPDAKRKTIPINVT